MPPKERRGVFHDSGRVVGNPYLIGKGRFARDAGTIVEHSAASRLVATVILCVQLATFTSSIFLPQLYEREVART